MQLRFIEEESLLNSLCLHEFHIGKTLWLTELISQYGYSVNSTTWLEMLLHFFRRAWVINLQNTINTQSFQNKQSQQTSQTPKLGKCLQKSKANIMHLSFKHTKDNTNMKIIDKVAIIKFHHHFKLFVLWQYVNNQLHYRNMQKHGSHEVIQYTCPHYHIPQVTKSDFVFITTFPKSLILIFSSLTHSPIH